MAYRGAGAPPPRRDGGGGGNKPIYHLSEKVTGKSGPEFKLVKALKLRPGDKNHPILTLDDFTSLEDAYSVNIHMFNLRGTKDNIVVCPMTESDSRPCPICEVLNRGPSWYVCVTGIDRQVYEFEKTFKGQTSKVSYTDLRRLVLVTQTWLQRRSMDAERAKGWRGSLWHVSRSKPTQETGRDGQLRTSFKDSPRTGDMWYFEEKYDEEKMRKELEGAAAKYGLPVEAFIQPFDYDVLLKPKDHKQLLAIANDIRQDGSSLKQPESASTADSSSSAAEPTGAASGAEAEIPY